MLLSITIFFMVLKYMQSTKPSYLDKVNKLNNKLLRILQNKPITTPLCELYKPYNALTIPNHHK